MVFIKTERQLGHFYLIYNVFFTISTVVFKSYFIFNLINQYSCLDFYEFYFVNINQTRYCKPRIYLKFNELCGWKIFSNCVISAPIVVLFELLRPTNNMRT